MGLKQSFQANIFTGEVEKVNQKEGDQTEEQMDLDALTSNSASLREPLTKVTTMSIEHLNILSKTNIRQDSKSGATE